MHWIGIGILIGIGIMLAPLVLELAGAAATILFPLLLIVAGVVGIVILFAFLPDVIHAIPPIVLQLFGVAVLLYWVGVAIVAYRRDRSAFLEQLRVGPIFLIGLGLIPLLLGWGILLAYLEGSSAQGAVLFLGIAAIVVGLLYLVRRGRALRRRESGIEQAAAFQANRPQAEKDAAMARHELISDMYRDGAPEEWVERVRRARTVAEVIAVDDEYQASRARA